MTTDQIADALYPSIHAAQARLRTLTGYGLLLLLLRFQPYRLQGGNFPYHYVLDHLGALIIAFYPEYDAGTENQTTLVDKVTRYDELPEGRWPVLFSPPSTLRKGHFPPEFR